MFPSTTRSCSFTTPSPLTSSNFGLPGSTVEIVCAGNWLRESAIGKETKFELTARVDEAGAFKSVALESTLKLNANLKISNVGTFKVNLSSSGSVELKKFTGTVSKPSNAADYKELEGFQGGDIEDNVWED